MIYMKLLIINKMNKSDKLSALQAFEKSFKRNKNDSPLMIERQSTLGEDLANALNNEPLKKQMAPKNM